MHYRRFSDAAACRLCLPAVIATLLLLPSSAGAQVQPEASVGLMVGFPSGEFKEHVSSVGIGLNFGGGIQLSQTPLFIGGELGFLIYGHDSRRERFSETIQEVEVRVVTTNNILQGNLFLRLQPSVGTVRPYFEGLLGFKWFFTETRIRNVYTIDEPIAESINLGDVALGYGYGCGAAFHLVDRTGRWEETGEGPVRILLDLRLTYLMGSEAEYLKKGSIDRSGGNLIYNIERSETDFLIPSIGVRFVF